MGDSSPKAARAAGSADVNEIRVALDEVPVVCSRCGFKSNALRINQQKEFFHNSEGFQIRFPNRSLSVDECNRLKKMALRCDLCKEDDDEYGSPF